MTSLTRRTLAPLALLAAGTLVLAGCGSSDSASSSASGSSGSSSAAAAPTALASGMGSDAKDGQFPRTVTGFRGKTTIPSAPKKVVVLSTGQFDDALALGVVPEGATSAKNADLVPEYLTTKYSQDAQQIKDVASVGSRQSPNIEKIAALKPDLILVNNTLKDDKTYASLSSIAPTVVTEGTGVNWKQDFLLVGAALGKQDEAQKQLDDYASRARQVGEKFGTDKTVSFLRYQSDRTRIWGVGSFVGSISQDAGLARPESQQFSSTSKDVSSEELDRADGDWLFYGAQSGKASGLESEALWKSLGAVKNGHAVHVDDEEFFLNAGMTAADGVLDAIEAHAGK